VLKVCRTPGPTACLKMLNKVCLKSWRRRKNSMTGPSVIFLRLRVQYEALKDTFTIWIVLNPRLFEASSQPYCTLQQILILLAISLVSMWIIMHAYFDLFGTRVNDQFSGITIFGQLLFTVVELKSQNYCTMK